MKENSTVKAKTIYMMRVDLYNTPGINIPVTEDVFNEQLEHYAKAAEGFEDRDGEFLVKMIKKRKSKDPKKIRETWIYVDNGSTITFNKIGLLR